MNAIETLFLMSVCEPKCRSLWQQKQFIACTNNVRINEIRAACSLRETHFTWFDFSKAICRANFFSPRTFLLLFTLDMFVYVVFSLQPLRRQICKDTQCSATFYYMRHLYYGMICTCVLCMYGWH